MKSVFQISQSQVYFSFGRRTRRLKDSGTTARCYHIGPARSLGRGNMKPNDPRRLTISIGDKFGRLEVIEKQADPRGDWRSRLLCLCACGKKKWIFGYRLVNRKDGTKSCGCARPKNVIHGMYLSPEYRAYYAMKQRCYNPNGAGHTKYYIEPGVKVCQRWLDSFDNFLSDVGIRPAPGYSIDRFPDPYGDYEPGNVRWATAEQQANNRRSA